MRAAFRTALSEPGLLLLAFAFMAIAVALDHGHYSPRALAALLVAAACLAGAGQRYAHAGAAPREAGSAEPANGRSLDVLLALALIVLLIAGTLDAPGIYLIHDGFTRVAAATNILLAIAVAVAFVGLAGSGRAQRAVLVAGVVAGFALRAAMIVESPSPVIDVFTQFQESAAHLLGGLNPFTTPVSDPSGGRLDFGYRVTGYSYPPAGLYLQTVAYALAGDIRYAHVAFEAVTAAAIYAIAAPIRRGTAALLVLLFLFNPRGLFVIEQAWNEPLLVGALAVAVWLTCARPASKRIAAAFGIFLSLKQYLIFFAVAFMIRPKPWRMLMVATGIILLTWIPFLLWDATSAINLGLLAPLGTPFRPDGLTVSAALFRTWGWSAGKVTSIVVGTAVTLATVARGQAARAKSWESAWLYPAVQGTFAAFLVGSQAFANYYYFIASALLLLLSLRLVESAASPRSVP